MKIERTKNATRNIVFGGLQKVYQMIVPFLMRTAMIYFMGVQYLGLNSLFTSILQVLNLAELGVGSAMVYSMYKPIAEDDHPTICALMKLYKMYYRFIGLFIAVAGLLATPLIPNLISGAIPEDLDIYILYLLNLAATVLSYWLFAYKNCLLVAHQRVDVTSKIIMISNTAQFVLQFIVLVFFKNYYIYLLISLFNQICINISTAVVASKMYPEYRAEGELDKESRKKINDRIRDLFTSKIGGVVLNSADTIVISAFLGLTTLAIYQNYYFIISSVKGFIEIILTAITAGIGNSLIAETKEKNYNDMKKFTFMFVWLIGFCTCCFLCLYQPFMAIWVGEDLKLTFTIVICLCVYFFLYEVIRLLSTFKDAAGIWHEDRFRPLVSSLVNLALNIATVKFFGLYGVVFSTVVALLVVELPWILRNLFSVLYDNSLLGDYLKHFMFYLITTVGACCVTLGICSLFHFGNMPTLIVRVVICLIIPNVFFFVVYYKQKEFKDSLIMIAKIVNGKFKIGK